MQRASCLVALLVFSLSAAAEKAADPAHDSRIRVDMPATAQAQLRTDMLDHLAALNAIIAALGKSDLNTAADIAEQQLGTRVMGKHRGSGPGPGRFMPDEMRKIGWGMHEAADRFAVKARESGSAAGAYAALQNITSACVSCHAIYRTR